MSLFLGVYQTLLSQVIFGGVRRDDAEARIGRFRTFDPHGDSMRIISVAYDHPEDLGNGERNMWDGVMESIKNNEVVSVQVMR